MVKGALLMNRDLTASSNDTSSESRDLTMSSPLVNTTKEIVNITTFAAEKAKALMKDRDLEDAALRVFVTPGGCAGYEYGMAIAETVEVSDKLIENNGLKIVIDNAAVPLVNKLLIRNVSSVPNATPHFSTPLRSKRILDQLLVPVLFIINDA